MLKQNNNLKWSRIILNTIIVFIFISIPLFTYLFIISKDLPSLNELQKFNPQQVSKIISSDGVVINKLYTHKRDMISISAIPKDLRNALLSMEDREFYQHSGY